MNRRRQLVCSNEAEDAKGQHRKPCSDCPWARTALNGWLGPYTIQEWLDIAHGPEEMVVDCHTLRGAQCAGFAIYQANVGKMPRNQALLTLPPDEKSCFATPQEFQDHHEKLPEGRLKRR